MKALPWLCLSLVVSQSVLAATGIDAYRIGNYVSAAEELPKSVNQDPVANYYLGMMRLYGYGELKNNPLAIRYLEQAAEKGYLPAQNMLARYNLTKENNPEKALYWFKKAAANGDLAAQMYSAAAYLFGYGTKKNEDMARRYYIDAAKSGNSIAQYTLAENFLNSRHAENRKLGLIWLSKAVEQGNLQAKVKQAELYADGSKLVTPDQEQAKALFNAAIAEGSVDALYGMGKLAEQQKDYPSAKEWYTKAAEKQDRHAQFALAQLYLKTDTPLADSATGFSWMLKAAQNNNKEAEKALAKLYSEGKVVPKDDNLAKEWQAKANAKDTPAKEEASALAANWLSNGRAKTLIESGYGLNGIFTAWQNPVALKENRYNPAPQMETISRASLYKPQFVMVSPDKIAINEFYDALARSRGALKTTPLDLPAYPLNKDAYLVQKGLSSEPHDLIDLLTREAVLGDPGAQFTLAQLYQQGVGVKQNNQEAIKYYQMASDQHDLRAEYSLAALYLSGKVVSVDFKQGVQLLADAAFRGSAYAEYALGQLHEQGYQDAEGKELLKPNTDAAIALFSLASANRFGPAEYRLAEILVRQKPDDLSVAAREKRNQLTKRLYQGAVDSGVVAANLPLAFFNAMDPDKTKQKAAFDAAYNAAKDGNGEAALLVGLMYDRGLGVSANQGDAIDWYERATVNPVTAFILGTYLSQGDGISQDMTKGRALLQQSAESGLPYASLNLAILKQKQGEDFLPDLNAALEAGNSTAGLLLADYYLSQPNDDKNMARAQAIYQRFAEKGDKDAQLKLAYMEEHGLGGKVDLANAQKWYEQAAVQGQPVAQYLLAQLYQLGGASQVPDYDAAIKWYTEAEKQFRPAAVALGFLYDTVKNNYGQALAYYQRASDNQSVIATYDLATIYELGKGYPVDYAKAKQLYFQAAQKGHSQAMVQLAKLYFSGLGGMRDEAQAVHWYKKAAALGNREALYQLGLLSETGVEVPQNYRQAASFYQKSAAKGDAQAMLALARLYQYGLGTAPDTKEAVKLYQTLANQQNAYAQYQLAAFYYQGIAGEKNTAQGKKLLVQAQDNGSVWARNALQWLNAQREARASYVEAIPQQLNYSVKEQAAPTMYLEALNELNRGDVELSRSMLHKIMQEFPQFLPAKQAFEQLQGVLPARVFS